MTQTMLAGFVPCGRLAFRGSTPLAIFACCAAAFAQSSVNVAILNQKNTLSVVKIS
jgi:hypothetical protein